VTTGNLHVVGPRPLVLFAVIPCGLPAAWSTQHQYGNQLNRWISLASGKHPVSQTQSSCLHLQPRPTMSCMHGAALWLSGPSLLISMPPTVHDGHPMISILTECGLVRWWQTTINREPFAQMLQKLRSQRPDLTGLSCLLIPSQDMSSNLKANLFLSALPTAYCPNQTRSRTSRQLPKQ
jgi:hypothetical protein